MSPYQGSPGEVIDSASIDVFRGGTDWAVKPGDVRVINGLVQPTHGPSLDTDPSRLGSFGGARRLVSIPSELQIIQRGKRATHFEIVPKEPMTPEQFQELVNQIVTE